MTNYSELYAQKLTTAEEAVKVVESGDWVDYGWTTGHPVALDKALGKLSENDPPIQQPQPKASYCPALRILSMRSLPQRFQVRSSVWSSTFPPLVRNSGPTLSG